MAFPHRVFRIFWVSLGLLILGIPALSFILARVAEQTLRTERHLGDWTFKFSGATISPFLAFRADSAQFQSSHTRIFVSSPSVNLLDWIHLWSGRALIRATVDSAELRIAKDSQPSSTVPKFPELRFPLPVSLEWRVLDIRPESGPFISASGAKWRSQGPWGLKGVFHGRFESKPPTDTAPPFLVEADFSAHAHWFGRSVHYEVEVSQNTDTIRILGTRNKQSLLFGEDSLRVAISNPKKWIPVSLTGAPELSGLSLEGKIDWRREKLFLKSEFHSGEYHVLEPFLWNGSFRYDSTGGSINVDGKGASKQFIHLQGQWKNPPAWLAKPDWKSYAAKFTGQTGGIRWQIGPHNLPLDFTLTSLHLQPGLVVEGTVITSDSSALDLHWKGDQPRKFEVSGTISPREPWAIIWTDTNVSFHAARVEGEWDVNRFRGTAWMQGVSAYGSEWDSLEADQEVLPTGYYLKDARLYRDGQTFRGSGQVVWAPNPRHQGPSLTFKLSHPEYGQLRFAMSNPDSMDAWMEAAQVTRFPYSPLKRFSRFHPQVDGHFSWNHVTGIGQSDASAVFSYQNKELKSRVVASWDRDSLRLAEFELSEGPSQLKGSAVISLGGRSLEALHQIRPDAVGSLQVAVEQIRMGEVLEWMPVGTSKGDGILTGNIQYSRDSGWQGVLRASDVQVPALHGLMDITSLSLSGHGDSLLLTMRTASTKHPLLADTVEARLFGLHSASPSLAISAHSGPLFANFNGRIPQWKSLQGNIAVTGRAALGAPGFLDQVSLEGPLSFPFAPDADSGIRFSSRQFQLRYILAQDTQWLDGHLNYAKNMLTAPDLRVRHSQGGELKGQLEARLAEPMSVRFDFAGSKLKLVLPEGQQIEASGVSGNVRWEKGSPLRVNAAAQSGAFLIPGSTLRVKSAIEGLELQASIPPADAPALPTLKVRGRLRDFLFQRKIGFQDAQNFFRSFKSRKDRNTSGRHSKPWDLDMQLEAVGANNRINTDVVRFTFLGDLQVKGVYPYTLLNGKISGLQGEIGQAGQAYDLRDFEVKWQNSTLDEGTIFVEGDKKLRTDCKPTTQRTCTIFIKLNGRLSEMNFNYDTDCGQNIGEPASPAVLINSVTQGCYSSEFQSGGKGRYGEAVVNMLEPAISENLTKGVKWASGGFIESTQLSGLGSLVGGDTASFEPVALEVATREKYRTSLKGKTGYHPERKLADPWEYRLAAVYRIPLDKLAVDSVWQVRLKDRFTLETSVETRPPDVLSQEEGRQVREQAGLRYHYRFWGWW